MVAAISRTVVCEALAFRALAGHPNAMFFRELNRGKCKTYLIACERTRQAAIVDPLKENTGRYIAVAAYHGLRIEYAIDTHTHADHRSGTWDLADLTDAKVVMERHAPAPHVHLHVAHGE